MKKNNILLNLLFAVTLCILSAPVFGAEVAPILSPVIGVATFITLQYFPMPVGVLGLNNTNNASAEASFLKAKRIFFKAFRNKFPDGPAGDMACQNYVDSLKLSQNEIRCEVNLTTTASNFIFGVNPQQQNTGNTQFLTERRLNQQDTLCVNEYGIFVAQTAGTNDAAYRLNTYGNQILFPAADANQLDTVFYSNGGFQMKVNNDVVIPYRGLFNHFYRPQTQQTAALGAGSPGDQIRGAEDGIVTQEPNILLIGSKNYVPEIVLPTNLTGTFTNVRAILLFRGILAQNSTVVS
jgi:hypothetical protein